MRYKLIDTQWGETYELDSFEELKELMSDLLSEWGENMPNIRTMNKLRKARGIKKLMRIIKNNVDLNYCYKIKGEQI